MIEVICRNSNNNLVPIKGERTSFRLRQRAKDWQGCKVKPLRFISFKEAHKIMDKKIIYPEVTLYSVSKL
jgi:ribosomal protein L35AE/L33A